MRLKSLPLVEKRLLKICDCCAWDRPLNTEVVASVMQAPKPSTGCLCPVAVSSTVNDHVDILPGFLAPDTGAVQVLSFSVSSAEDANAAGVAVRGTSAAVSCEDATAWPIAKNWSLACIFICSLVPDVALQTSLTDDSSARYTSGCSHLYSLITIHTFTLIQMRS